MIRDVVCRRECLHKSAEEFSRFTQLVFPYRGVYVRHLGYRRPLTICEWPSL
jgi:hypothetical protein